jgi:hypothetical protein
MSTQLKILIALGSLIALVVVALGIVNYPGPSHEGYAPQQPIPYSHKLHAGALKIPCQYCHSGVEFSKHANIPSLGVCMNCHRVVKTDSPHIQKITQLYNEGKSIEWVRVHELPDHVRFNHQPHIAKGIACQQCHGPIQEMDTVTQNQPLTMGWCLSCHRGQTTPDKIRQAAYEGKVKQSELRQAAGLKADAPNPHGNDVAPYNCSTCHY